MEEYEIDVGEEQGQWLYIGDKVKNENNYVRRVELHEIEWYTMSKCNFFQFYLVFLS